MTERRKSERMKRQKDKMKKKKTERQRGVEVGHHNFRSIVLDDLNGPGSRVKKKIPILTIFGVPNYASQIP